MAQLSQLQGALHVGNSEDRHTTQKEQLGALAYDVIGNEYRYIKAGEALGANDAVDFNGSALGFDDVRKATDVDRSIVGVALTAFASGEYGWVLRRGVGSVKTTGSVAVKTVLAASATDGTLATKADTDNGDAAAIVLVNSASPQVCYICGV